MMFTHVWNKYLPIIRILFKRARMEDQVLDMNEIDFVKAAGGKKCSYKCNIHFQNGRVDNILTSPVAKDLSLLLLSDGGIMSMLGDQDVEIHMNKKFQLAIHMQRPQDTGEEAILAGDENDHVSAE